VYPAQYYTSSNGPRGSDCNPECTPVLLVCLLAGGASRKEVGRDGSSTHACDIQRQDANSSPGFNCVSWFVAGKDALSSMTLVQHVRAHVALARLAKLATKELVRFSVHAKSYSLSV
jgi:hypothetical protein